MIREHISSVLVSTREK